MLRALKLLRVLFSMLCALGALLLVAGAISPLVLLLILAGYVGVTLGADYLARPRAVVATSVKPPKPKRERQPRPRRSVRRTRPRHKLEWLFSLITGLIPLVLLLLLEFGLRMGGYNHSYPLFIDSPGASGYMQVNPEIVKRFLISDSPASAMQMDTIFFRKAKPANSFRIVVMGESSAAGFPYGRFGSLAGMLNQRLKHTFPDREIEVITTAMPAITSYMLLDFADEIIAQRPDAVLIYTGHNEYLGLLGVGSAVSVSQSRAISLSYLKLRELRSFQLLKQAYVGAGSGQPQANTNVMATIAAEKEIAYGSSLYEAGVEQFRSNIDDLLARYQQAGIPVLIGTLASNERDQQPFVGNSPASGATGADAYFAQGRELEQQGKYDEARTAYLAAKDHDQLRFRAPEAFNDVIRQVAQQRGALVVDVQQAFRARASHGIIGKELMLEHVHPNVTGYFTLADAFYNTLKERQMIGSWEHAIPSERALEDIPLTEVDLLYGQYKVQQLTSDYPFQKTKVPFTPPQPANLIEQLAQQRYYERIQWLDHSTKLLEHYMSQKDDANVRKLALILSDAVPFSSQYQALAGTMLNNNGQPLQALPYLKQAVALSPTNANLLFELAKSYHQSGQIEQARSQLGEVLKLAPTHQPAQELLNTLNQAAGS